MLLQAQVLNFTEWIDLRSLRLGVSNVCWGCKIGVLKKNVSGSWARVTWYVLNKIISFGIGEFNRLSAIFISFMF
jgi:hypothetical protein